jgi:hypothetical protein
MPKGGSMIQSIFTWIDSLWDVRNPACKKCGKREGRVKPVTIELIRDDYSPNSAIEWHHEDCREGV